MYIRLFIGGVFIFLLSSCGSGATDTTNTGYGATGSTKSPFEVSVLKVSDASEVSFVEKTGRITASSTLTLTSQ